MPFEQLANRVRRLSADTKPVLDPFTLERKLLVVILGVWVVPAEFFDNAAVARSPLYDGLAIMTPIDPDPDFMTRLRSVLEGSLLSER